MAELVVSLVRLYQLTLSKCLPPDVCIYEPSCSQYMIDAVCAKGFLRGVCLGLWRICRCHPYARGGYDPAPVGMEEPESR